MADLKVTNDMKIMDIALQLGEDISIDFLMSIEYQGFDPEKTWQVLASAAARMGLTVKEMAADMQKIILFYVQRGTRFGDDNFNKKTKASAATQVNTLMGKYGIKKNLEGDFAPERVSVARVAILFAAFVAACYNVGAANPIVTPDSDLPRCFAFPAAASVMTAEEWSKYKDRYLSNMVSFTRIINRNFSNTKAPNQVGLGQLDYASASDETIKGVQENIARVAHESAFSKSTRKPMRNSAAKFEKSLAAVMMADVRTRDRLIPAEKRYDLTIA